MARRSHAGRKTHLAAILTIAAVALLSPLTLMSAWVHAESLSTQVYSTAIGEIRSVLLGEWIGMRLNTGTGVTVTEGAQMCEVALDHGEALFELERGSQRTLRVVAGNAVVSTQAATFSVRVRDPKTVDVVVRSGVVTVGAITVRERHFARVSAGRSGRADGVVVLRELRAEEVARRLEWTTGRLTFAGETLAEATAEFNRYNTRKLIIADSTISSIPIGGQFLSSDVQSFVTALGPLGVAREKVEAADAGGDSDSDGNADADNAIRLIATKTPPPP